MLYNYYIQAFSGRPIRCPEGREAAFFQAILDVAAMDRKTAETVLQMGIGINAPAFRFFAVPAGRLRA